MKKIILIMSGVAVGAAVVNFFMRRRNLEKNLVQENEQHHSTHHLTNVFASAKEHANKV